MILVRPNDPLDGPTILSIERQCFENPWNERDFKSCLRHKETACLVVEDMTDKIPGGEIAELPGFYSPDRQFPVIGYCVLEVQERGVWIISMGVEAANRRRRAGSAMVDHIMRNIEPGQTVCVMIGERNAGAAQFFVDNGFQLVGTCDDWFDEEDGQTAYMLERVKDTVHANSPN